MSASNRIPRHIEEALRTNRRDFLKGAGLLAVSFGVFGGAAIRAADAQTAAVQGAGPYPDPDFRQIDSWIVIHEDNTATFFVGKTDPGQGTGTGFRQLMSDELDIAFDRTTCIMGSTDITVDQVGSGGSTAMERDSWPMRRVAAEARRVLLDMASVRLGVRPSNRLESYVLSCCAPTTSVAALGDGRVGVPPIEPEDRIGRRFIGRGDTT